jgi:hypothetical protein
MLTVLREREPVSRLFVNSSFLLKHSLTSMLICRTVLSGMKTACLREPDRSLVETPHESMYRLEFKRLHTIFGHDIIASTVTGDMLEGDINVKNAKILYLRTSSNVRSATFRHAIDVDTTGCRNRDDGERRTWENWAEPSGTRYWGAQVVGLVEGNGSDTVDSVYNVLGNNIVCRVELLAAVRDI